MYKINLESKYEINQNHANKMLRKLKKSIGQKIFQRVDAKNNESDFGYYQAIKLHEDIFEENGWTGIRENLVVLAMAGNIEWVKKEHAVILDLECKCEKLEKELKYYKELSNRLI